MVDNEQSNEAETGETAKLNAGLRFCLYGVVPVLVIGLLGYFYATGGRYISTENAYVKANIVQISPNIDGLITDVFVTENQFVEAGDPIFNIDSRPFQNAFAVAQSDLAKARQTIEALRAHFRQGQSLIKSEQERVRYLKGEYLRREDLLKKGHGTQAEFDKIEHELNTAKQRLASVREDNKMVLAELAGKPNISVFEHPVYMRAEAEHDMAALNLSYTSVLAPTSGIISRVSMEPGEYVEAGRVSMAIVGTHDLWIEANLKEVDLTHIRVGQKATVVLDSLPDVEWAASVQSISPATGSEFSVLPSQNSTGNWVKVVQRIPVRLILAERAGKDALRAGLTATISIDTEHQRNVGSIIGKVLAQTFSE